jgi:hypothetical protein
MRYSYFTRESYQELVDAINRLGYADNLVILSINTPGLEYYSSQPVIDLFMLGFIENSGLENSTFPLGIANVTRTLEFFDQYDISILIALNSSNDWYPAYLDRIYWNYFVYRFMNNNDYFTWRFSNKEYIMYTTNSYDPYVGPVDIQLVGPLNKGSLLARTPDSTVIIGNTGSIETEIDLTAVQTTGTINVTVRSEYSTISNETMRIESNSFQFSKPELESFLRLSLLTLPDETVYLHDIEIQITYENLEGIVENFDYTLQAFQGSSVNITRTANSWLFEGYYGFIYV